MSNEDDRPANIDDVDRAILYALQQDARNATTTGIGKDIGVSASTIRNRIERLEGDGIIEGYQPKLNYEQAGFPLRLIFTCTAPPDERNTLARDVLNVRGVIDVRELVTSEENLLVEAVAVNTRDVVEITRLLNEKDIKVNSSEMVTSHHTRLFGFFESVNGDDTDE
ncbi:Lrp/AsnC family transcriptional regulator [Salinigranum sp. GCM10025319]|uniref:Lrp/AsnC family transcriptional regulator n=1 Tax=Salinigranum sp. GCM10025319 TaxID=3252687 RepID=UPI00361CF890